MAEIIYKICLFLLLSYGVTADSDLEDTQTDAEPKSSDLNQVNDRYYPRYHLAPPSGWMNDPNGFSIYNNEYHLFYQYNPNSSLEPGIAHWGHATSNDLFHWEHKPIAMYPDQWYDKSGVFSGSAIVENDKMYLFYTGNLNHPGETPDHEQHQALATSSDGKTFSKYEKNPIINGLDRQPNIRDPKVWKYEDTYYMVLGNSFKNDSLGRVLLYSSKDMISWDEISILAESDGALGYMWECPDFFELNGKFVLLFSPQGIEPQEDKYRNLYQTGYIVGNFDYTTHKFTPTSKFRELDHGHDLYATQSLLDSQGRRIVIAWLDMWETNYPEQKDGFTGMMTVPRQLSLTSDDYIIQKPLEETSRARGRHERPGKGKNARVYTLKDKAGEVNIQADGTKNLELFIQSQQTVVSIKYDAENGQVTLDRGGNDGIRRTEWKPTGDLKWVIYIDASSIELFCGEGEVTFTSRFFPKGPVKVRVGERSPIPQQLSVYSMNRTVPRGNNQRWSITFHSGK